MRSGHTHPDQCTRRRPVQICYVSRGNPICPPDLILAPATYGSVGPNYSSGPGFDQGSRVPQEETPASILRACVPRSHRSRWRAL